MWNPPARTKRGMSWVPVKMDFEVEPEKEVWPGWTDHDCRQLLPDRLKVTVLAAIDGQHFTCCPGTAGLRIARTISLGICAVRAPRSLTGEAGWPAIRQVAVRFTRQAFREPHA